MSPNTRLFLEATSAAIDHPFLESCENVYDSIVYMLF